VGVRSRGWESIGRKEIFELLYCKKDLQEPPQTFMNASSFFYNPGNERGRFLKMYETNFSGGH
jgi:hypothetical protein